MDHINKVLATSSDDHNQFSLLICVALVIGKNTMNQYNNKTDSSETYRIAMSTYHSYFGSIAYYLLVSSSPMSQAFLFQNSGLGRTMG